MSSYRPSIEFFRTPAERADPFLSWARDDVHFFAAGACHILADLFIQLHPNEGFERIHIKPHDPHPGNHVYVTDGIWAFDYGGWTKEQDLLAITERAYQLKYPGWKFERMVVKDDLETFCRKNHHRLPYNYAYLPWERAYAFLKQFPASPPSNTV